MVKIIIINLSNKNKVGIFNSLLQTFKRIYVYSRHESYRPG